MMHTLVCRLEDKWAVLLREHPTVDWSLTRKENLLRTALDASLKLDLLTHNWTFSERQAADVIANIAEEPEQIAAVDPRLSIVVLSPEGRFEPDDRWATMRRLPGVALWTNGLSDLFRPKALQAQIEEFFGIDTILDDRKWKTFVGGKHGIARPTHLRELWIRPAWRARQLCPSDFPPVKLGPIISPEIQEKRASKMPQNRSAVRRAKHAENDRRFKAEAAERARLRGEVA